MPFFRELADFFLPQVCLFCGKPGLEGGRHPICEECLKGITPLSSPMCVKCGEPILGGSPEGHLCGRCLQSPPPFRKARSLYPYLGSVKNLVHALKFQKNLASLGVVGVLLDRWEEADAICRRFDLVVPVPLDEKTLRNRGYNQALLLAVAVSKRVGKPVDRTHLIKTRETPPQVGLTKAQRERNLRGAFFVPFPASFRGKEVLLVDDVYTTGATVRECASTLVRAGARGVDVLTLARVVSE